MDTLDKVLKLRKENPGMTLAEAFEQVKGHKAETPESTIKLSAWDVYRIGKSPGLNKNHDPLA